MDQSSYIYDVGFATHPGRVRARNEDAHLTRPGIGLWAVADGMGGHDAGDVASQMVVQALDAIPKTTSATELLDETKNRIFEANRQILEISRQRGGTVMGSTIAVLLISDDYYACIWAGDSRLYLVNQGAVRQISHDHTEAAELVASGAMTSEEAKSWPQNVITRAVGVEDAPELEIVTGAFVESDIFVLCSDGLNKHVSDDEILQHVLAGGAQSCCEALVELALDRGGLDNVTVLVIRPLRGPSGDGTTPDVSDGTPTTGIWE